MVHGTIKTNEEFGLPSIHDSLRCRPGLHNVHGDRARLVVAQQHQLESADNAQGNCALRPSPKSLHILTSIPWCKTPQALLVAQYPYCNMVLCDPQVVTLGTDTRPHDGLQIGKQRRGLVTPASTDLAWHEQNRSKKVQSKSAISTRSRLAETGRKALNPVAGTTYAATTIRN
jgi:hypothetical protein